MLRVLYVEGELTNHLAQLQGTNQSPGGYAGSTQGDWITGTPYPIVDLSSSTSGANSFLGSAGYQIAYFPSVYMICPDRTITLVGQSTTAQLYAAKASCSMALVANDAQLMDAITIGTSNSNLQSCDSVTPTFRLGNIGTTNLTNATITYKVDGVTQKVKNWTGNLAPYNNATVTGVKLGGTTSGSHAITATVSSPNGGLDPTATNNNTTASFVKLSGSIGPVVNESFETSGIPSNWAIFNGGSTTTWETENVGFNSSQSAKLDFYSIPAGDIDFFAFDPMDFTGATAIQLTFDVSYAQSAATVNDKLEVDVSTNCGTSWIPRKVLQGASLSTNGTTYYTSSYMPSTASQWRNETVSLNSYANAPSVWIRFKGISASGNNVFVDNINVSMTMGVNELSAVSEVNVYPNPMADESNVYFDLSESTNVSISLTNELGQQILKSELGNLSAGAQDYLLNTTGVTNGLYFLTIKTNKATITKKVSVNK